jgi:hypothetical protein
MMPYTAAMKDARLELRIERKLMARIDQARGDVSRTRWVERALESALGDVAPASPGAEGGGRLPSSPAPTRAPTTPTQVVKEALSGPVPEIPDEAPMQIPKRVPGVTTAREIQMERQRKLNEKR